MIVHRDMLKTFQIRAQILKFIRNYLDNLGFLEVETPIVWTSVGGAVARPFLTRANAMADTQMSLRIAPELFLKKVVIGGLDRVYEMSKVFRNEGIDATHNPVFFIFIYFYRLGIYNL